MAAVTTAQTSTAAEPAPPVLPRPPASELRLADGPLHERWAAADVVAVTVARPAGSGESVPGAFALAVAERLGLDLPAVLAAEKAGGRAGEATRLPVPPGEGRPGRVVAVGVGPGAPRRRAGRRRRGARRPGPRPGGHRPRRRR